MALCNVCGGYITEDMKQCPKCATPISPNYDYQATLDSIQNVYDKFENDLDVFVDRSKLTYICALCGGVNHIDKRKCYRCGKPRPRSEYIKALKTLKRKTATGDNVFAEVSQPVQPQAQEPTLPVEEKAAPSKKATITAPPPPEVASLAEQRAALGATDTSPRQKATLYRYERGHSQTRPITQPFVIVPYVNPTQPLYQYDPYQIYKFQPDTYIESVNKQDAQRVYQQGPTPTPSDLAVLRAQRLEEIEELTRKIKELEYFRQKAAKSSRKSRRSKR